MQRRGAFYMQGIGRRSRICCFALTAGVRSGVGVLVDYGCSDLKVVDSWYWEPSTSGETGNDRLALRLDAEEASRWWRLGFEDDSQDQ